MEEFFIWTVAAIKEVLLAGEISNDACIAYEKLDLTVINLDCPVSEIPTDFVFLSTKPQI